MKYKTGKRIPQSGIYEVTHGEHRLPHEVTLISGEIFPPCSKCANAVRFKLLRPVTVDWGKIVLNEIPTLLDPEQKVEEIDELDEVDRAG
jgi:hypothetical protein